jgi:hypothetical protein
MVARSEFCTNVCSRWPLLIDEIPLVWFANKNKTGRSLTGFLTNVVLSD